MWGARSAIVAMLLAGCSAQQGDAPASSASPAYGPLRSCATVTSQCPGVASIVRAAPSLCESTDYGTVCSDTRRTNFVGNSSRRSDVTYAEVHAAMDTSKGTCGLNAIYRERRGSFGPGEFAIVGIWGVRNGVYQYLEAQFLRTPDEARQLEDPRRFAEACSRLERIVS